MPNSHKTPGVYVVEQAAFPPSIVPVATDIPAFIGYTARAQRSGRSLRNRPTRVNSYLEFLEMFGVPPAASLSPASIRPRFRFMAATNADTADFAVNGTPWVLQADGSTRYNLLHSLRLFFDNGGGRCYIVSVGPLRRAVRTADAGTNPNVRLSELVGGLKALERESEPTMVVAPDATLLTLSDHAQFCQAALKHCDLLQSRIAILDIHGGDAPDPASARDAVTAFRANTGDTALKYGCAYFPFLRTTVVPPSEVTYQNVGGARALAKILPDAKSPSVRPLLAAMRRRSAPDGPSPAALDVALRKASPAYAAVHAALVQRFNILPPSAAMAGAFVRVDNNQGVWKAPANISLVGVASLTASIDSAMQEWLNVDANSGKSINAIRSFPGRGLLVWGARTLDGNSNDWRYINVRRTCIMIEQSITLGIAAHVFSPNNASTWASIQASLENFLMGLWQQGVLMGSKPNEAFAVRVGLGTTMTAQDIVDGTLNVLVLVCLVRPAEFISLSFRQTMQGA